MSAFVTGGTGFIGKRLVRRLLRRDGEPVYVLMFNGTPESMASLKEFWGEDSARVTAIAGDISKPGLGSRRRIRAGSKEGSTISSI